MEGVVRAGRSDRAVPGRTGWPEVARREPRHQVAPRQATPFARWQVIQRAQNRKGTPQDNPFVRDRGRVAKTQGRPELGKVAERRLMARSRAVMFPS